MLIERERERELEACVTLWAFLTRLMKEETPLYWPVFLSSSIFHSFPTPDRQ